MVKKSSLSLATFFTIAIALINQGMSMMKDNPIYGLVLIIVGFGILLVGAFLYGKRLLTLVSPQNGGGSNGRGRSVP